MLNLAPPSPVNLFVSQQKMYRMGYIGMLCEPKKIMKIGFIWKIIHLTSLKRKAFKIIDNQSLVSNEILCLLGLILMLSSSF